MLTVTLIDLAVSGHGGQVEDLDGDEKEDGLDEGWLGRRWFCCNDHDTHNCSQSSGRPM